MRGYQFRHPGVCVAMASGFPARPHKGDLWSYQFRHPGVCVAMAFGFPARPRKGDLWSYQFRHPGSHPHILHRLGDIILAPWK